MRLSPASNLAARVNCFAFLDFEARLPNLLRSFRQKDSHLIKCLGKLRVGNVDGDVCRHFDETLARELQPSNGLVPTRLTCKNEQAVSCVEACMRECICACVCAELSY